MNNNNSWMDGLTKIAIDSWTKHESDQEILANIWNELQTAGMEPSENLRDLAYQILSDSKPHNGFEKDGVTKVAFMPLLYEVAERNYASRKFFETKLQLMEWFTEKYGESLVGKAVIFMADGPGIEVEHWTNTYVAIEIGDDQAQFVGIIDGKFPDMDINYDDHFKKVDEEKQPEKSYKFDKQGSAPSM